MGQQIFLVNTDFPIQLRTYLRGHQGITARMLKRLKAQENGITCNGKPIRVVDTVQNGDRIVLTLPEIPSFEGNPSLQIPIVWESEELVIYNKPVGMPVHPSAKHRGDTLGNAFAARYPDSAFHAVFRLDRNTSGLCAVAKSAYAANLMQGKFQKRYYALVPHGLHGNGTISAPIARQQESVITRCVREDGKQAVTHYRVLWEGEDCTLVECILETGRTHQIRVHMAHIGYPLLGDSLYGGDCSILTEQALHCGWLSFPALDDNKEIILTASLREDMLKLLPEMPNMFTL